MMNYLLKYILFILPVLGVYINAIGQDALNNQQRDTITLEYFTGIGCPNCDKIDAYIEMIDDKYSLVVIEKLEVFRNKENHKIMKRRYEKYGIPWSKQWVPAVFFGDKVFSGFSEIDKHLEPEILKLLGAQK